MHIPSRGEYDFLHMPSTLNRNNGWVVATLYEEDMYLDLELPNPNPLQSKSEEVIVVEPKTEEKSEPETKTEHRPMEE